MKQFITLCFILFATSTLSAQTGSIEMSTGGFSFIPAFTSKEPNIIINASTNPKRKLTGAVMYMMRMQSMTPTTVVLFTRYRFIDKKFKATAGIHMPAFQMTKDYAVTSFFGRELNMSYPLTEKLTLGSFILNGEARNTDFKVTLVSGNTHYRHKNWGFLTQGYYLSVGDLTGVAETISYDINSHFQAKAFGNYTLTDGNIIATVGLKYNL
ncbi:hypothetical protein [Aquirufa lenticrescens]|uniref:hypothetical protein n=1 Tax=Aquirufa lenticrescens TaxID=2696560 RepID=UPI001CAA6B53|nr:hypothetical protein [Aquirufa lenticrescens]UAJ14117.1 hypothetical protein G9X62_05915 [Aquirufa lenticrescens]